MDLLNKIIDFLTASPFDTEDIENKELHNELNRKIKKIKRNNKQFLIERQIKPFLIAEYMKNNNLLITEKDLEDAAEYEFNYAKRMGLIDDLNSLRIKE